MAGDIANRLANYEDVEWLTGYLDRGHRLLEQLNDLLNGA